MCLTIRKLRNRHGEYTPSVSEKDKTVYKVVIRSGGRLLTLHREFRVRIGQIMSVKRFSILGGRVFEGIHAFTTLRCAKEHTGFGINRKVIKCTIPKGTPYYYGEDRDIVSLKLKLEGTIYPK